MADLSSSFTQGMATGMQAPGRFAGTADALKNLLAMIQQHAQMQQQMSFLQQQQGQKFGQAKELQQMKGQQMKDIWGAKDKTALGVAGIKAGAALNKPLLPSQGLSQIKGIQAAYPFQSRIPFTGASRQIADISKGMAAGAGTTGGAPQHTPQQIALYNELRSRNVDPQTAAQYAFSGAQGAAPDNTMAQYASQSYLDSGDQYATE